MFPYCWDYTKFACVYSKNKLVMGIPGLDKETFGYKGLIKKLNKANFYYAKDGKLSSQGVKGAVKYLLSKDQGFKEWKDKRRGGAEKHKHDKE